MLIFYPAIFHNENKSVCAEFPDLDGCQTYGKDIEETIEHAQEALGLYASSISENGYKLPSPSSISDFNNTSDSFVTYIYCEIDNATAKLKAED